MAVFVGVRRAVVVATLALVVPVVPSAAAETGDARPSSTPSPTGSRPGGSVPSEADVSEAQAAAAAASKEVADITAQVERAEARLETLQREVAEAVADQEQAQQQLADAEGAARRATWDLADARRTSEAAGSTLSGTAALMYMQGGDLQNLTTLLLSPPNTMLDLAVVLDQQANRVRDDLDVATSAAEDAASKERLLASARDNRAVAVGQARAKRSVAEKEAARAGAEAARLAEQQEELTARLEVLEKGASDLAGLRETAARVSPADLLGVQVSGSSSSAPRVAQQTARSMMASYGWDTAEFSCLVDLWHGESGWSWSATNVSSGAYGIPQSLPGWKMASAGSDWLTNPTTQLTWGMDYIESVYGSPCPALERWKARSPHWY